MCGQIHAGHVSVGKDKTQEAVASRLRFNYSHRQASRNMDHDLFCVKTFAGI